MYYKGTGVEKDHRAAVKWFQHSADLGDTLAQYNLGVMYCRGESVLQNFVMAYKWFVLSNSSGEKVYHLSFIRFMEQRMKVSQIEKAQEMARDWKPINN